MKLMMKMVLLILVLIAPQCYGQQPASYGMPCDPAVGCVESFCECQGGWCISCGHQGEPVCNEGTACVDDSTPRNGFCVLPAPEWDPTRCGHVGDVPCRINGEDFCYTGEVGNTILGNTICRACGGYQQPCCDGYCTYGVCSDPTGENGICTRTLPFEIEAVDYPYYVIPSGEKDLRVHWSGQPEFPVRIELRPKHPNGRTAFHTFDKRDEQNPLFFQSAMSLLDCNEGTTMQYDVVMIDSTGTESKPYLIEFYCSLLGIVGCWIWFDGGQAEFSPDGMVYSNEKQVGTWEQHTDNEYVITWSAEDAAGFVDTLQIKNGELWGYNNGEGLSCRGTAEKPAHFATKGNC